MDLSAKILIIDDFKTTRRILKTTLKHMGLTELTEASDGKEALKLLLNESFDLIISDWNMPNMSGLELIKAIKQNEALKSIPFIMVTSEANKNNVVAAIKAGVSDYLTKPFTAETITLKVKRILDNN
jgi:two-component system chemotaxis response regulator CheY